MKQLRTIIIIRDYRLPLAILLLTLATGSAQWLRGWLAPSPQEHDFIGPPRANYTLHDFVMRSYNAHGQPGLQVAAPQLERHEGDHSLYINAPVFELPSKQKDIPGWKGHATYAWVNAAGTQIKLRGQVSMHRAAYANTAAVRLQTSETILWPRENRVETAQPVEVTQGLSKMTGVGMRANLNDNHLEVLHDFHGIFPPRQSTSAATHPARHIHAGGHTTRTG